MESDGDHGHAEEQINIEPTSSEVLNSINMNNKGKLDDTNIPHMARTPLYGDARCSILQAILSLLNLKIVHGWTNNSLTNLLQ